jgi:flagellar motor switch protein FliN/FliY
MSDTPEQQPEAPEEVTELEKTIDEATEAVAVQANELAELAASSMEGENLGLGMLLEVPVRVTVMIGGAKLTFGELVKLSAGSIVELDREAHQPADILVNGKVVARGEIVTIDKNYGVRITEVDS